MTRLLLIAVVLGSGCCPAANRELPMLYDHRDDYYLRMAEITWSAEGKGVSSRGPLTFNGVVVEATAQHNEFDVRITNKSPRRIAIAFARAVYVDEAGAEHPVALLPGDNRETLCRTPILERDESIFCSVIPSAKEYKVREGCFADYMYREPLVPWEVASMDPEEAQRIVQALATSRQKVTLKVPATLGDHEGLLSFAVELADHPLRDAIPRVKKSPQ